MIHLDVMAHYTTPRGWQAIVLLRQTTPPLMPGQDVNAGGHPGVIVAIDSMKVVGMSTAVVGLLLRDASVSAPASEGPAVESEPPGSQPGT
jgi:hypothetical protein